ncbi:MAG: hypothetical protein UZ15_CFX003002479 [Chloroflexi bacterium OLB15]|nr:MAG: hypothetical protein UZ15_CFX003002479 [Chloroflexi bacterium OLB15]
MRFRSGWVVIVAIVALLTAFGAVSAQESQYIPAIVDFSADIDSVTLDAIDRGDASITLSWYIINVVPGQRVAVDSWRANGWIPAWPTEGDIPAIGEQTITVADTQSFAPPTYRLTLYSGQNIVDQRFLTISLAESTSTPAITTFSASQDSVEQATVERGTARVVVNWAVSGRPANSQLVFEQVLPDGSQVNVELPRTVYYVPSSGVGAVAPVNPGAGQTGVQLRLTLVNVISGEVYASSDIVVPFTGTQVVPADATASPSIPTPTPAPAVEATEEMTVPEATTEMPPVVEATTAPVGGPTIQTFTVAPASVPPGGSVTMTWNVLDATSVQISEVLPDSPSGLTYVQLPLSGSVSVPLPEAATTSVTYRLVARNAAGVEVSAEQLITVGG